MRGEDLWCITVDVSKNIFSGVMRAKSYAFFRGSGRKQPKWETEMGVWVIHSHEKTEVKGG